MVVKPPRRRRAPAETRGLLIAAARDILRGQGPQAVTLQAVARHAGVTHGNVTYHFGAVDALHAAMIATIVEDLAAATAVAVEHLRQGEAGPRAVVDVVFDAFESGGAARLIAWLAATGAGRELAPLDRILADLVGGLALGADGARAGGAGAIGTMVAMLVTRALGQALIGPELTAALGLAPDTARRQAAAELARLRASAADQM